MKKKKELSTLKNAKPYISKVNYNKEQNIQAFFSQVKISLGNNLCQRLKAYQAQKAGGIFA